MPSRKDPAYGQPHFPIHDVKDRDELAIAAGQTPRHRSSARKTVKLSELRCAQLTHVGGADRTRTGDPLLAKQVLSQLSYSPIQIPGIAGIRKLVGPGRFELPTSRLSSARSNQLSYEPDQTTEDGRRTTSGVDGLMPSVL